MTEWQQLFLLIFGTGNGLLFFKALHECKNKGNAFGLTRWLTLQGSFVWADAVVFSMFWVLASLVSWFLNDWLLFCLITSVFWVVRSIGEWIYWFNQQFSTIERNPPKTMPGFAIFKNDSIWFVYQIVWQCVTVVAVIGSLYIGRLWLISL